MNKLFNNLKLYVALGAFLLGIVSFVRDCSQDISIEESNYMNMAMKFRPDLKVVNSPEIISFELASTDKISVSEFYDSQSDTIDIHSSLTIKAKLNLVNVGNARAKVYAFGRMDTLSGDPKIRELLLNKKGREHSMKFAPISDYFWIKDVKPDDTTCFNLSHAIKFIEDSKFTVHFIFLYENDVGVLYDTYYWANYTSTPLVLKLPEKGLMDTKGNLIFTSKVDKSQVKEFFKLSDQNISSKIYSKKEAEDILKFLKRKAKKLKK